jgi:hypothetical protein
VQDGLGRKEVAFDLGTAAEESGLRLSYERLSVMYKISKCKREWYFIPAYLLHTVGIGIKLGLASWRVLHRFRRQSPPRAMFSFLCARRPRLLIKPII